MRTRATVVFLAILSAQPLAFTKEPPTRRTASVSSDVLRPVIKGTAVSGCRVKGHGIAICSPKNGAIISSPVHFIAEASTSCSKGVLSVGIDSFPGSRVYLGDGSTVDTFLPLSDGTYNMTVEVRDNCRGSTKKNVVVTVQGTSMLTYQYSSLRNGANTNESILTPSNVNVKTFGKLYSFPVDSLVYGQPLYVPNLQIAGVTHNVVFVITENNSIYAFDADNKSPTPLWHTVIDTPVPCSANQPVPGSSCNGVYQTSAVGITSTPVIDPNQVPHGAIYVEGRKDPHSAGKYFHGIHKYDLTTGKQMLGSPVVISGSVPGTGRDNVNGVVTFSQYSEHNKSALLLANGIVYVSFASINDAPIYHGWVFGYDATTMKQRYVFNTTPNNSSNQNGRGEQGGIWNGTLSADANNLVYAATGNGTWDTTVSDWGNTYLKLKPGSSKLQVADYFTPKALAFDRQDQDLGASAAILLPDQTGLYPHVMVGGGKNGTVYVVNRDNMSKYHSSGDRVLQELPGAVSVHLKTAPDCNDNHNDCNYGTPAYWNGNIYFVGVNDHVKAFAFSNGQLSGPTSISPSTYGFPGATPSVSANGNTNGIVWTIEPIKSILHAYDATNLANELYNSTQASGGRDSLGSNVKFTPPTIVNGKVFVGTKRAVVVYGLLP